MATVEASVEWFIAITASVIGVSHMFRPADWAEAFRRLHAAGRPGAFVNSGLTLFVGAAIVAGHGSWELPGAVLTGLGWLMIAKGSVGLIWPDLSLRSMRRGAESPRSFVIAGGMSLAMAAWAGYCVWYRMSA